MKASSQSYNTDSPDTALWQLIFYFMSCQKVNEYGYGKGAHPHILDLVIYLILWGEAEPRSVFSSEDIW